MTLDGGYKNMDINVRGKNIEVTPALEEYAHKKLAKVFKFFEDNAEIQVVLSVVREAHVVEVTVLFNSLILRSEENTDNMYASIDLAIDKIEKQVIKYRKKLNQRFRQSGTRQINERLMAEEKTAQEKESEEPKVVKTKQFLLKPMDVEEAILQMNLLSHDFFVFNNAETDSISVLYRRKDGNYGLIEPEF